MPHYRVQVLDQSGDLKGAVDLDCANDEAAKERVRVVLEGHGAEHSAELWRLVALLELNDPPN